MIRTISEQDWPQIMVIQSQVYHDVAPEPLAVMQGKWQRSPELCFVFYDEVKPESIAGYLLAHTWAGERLPDLGEALPEGVAEEYVFLHDLAVSPVYQGQGVGPQLVQHLLDRSQRLGWHEWRLVSVQGSVPFWQRFGFKLAERTVSASYGEGAALMRKLGG
ncbi:Acetyltransferase (GNAT) family protein [Marinomonas aquimarina]|uniref:Acetyltransferase (GNAT) family protein n=1 Tax=Marinomonas aquimarina TaxID=295068 RepID=A0A1A8T609_9GAMM|nr:N-acetyltransferase [Marinomonas aquimarina]SBS27053.1 Acetyltransferase (GNAT) family protein [Marinomonas aquimarina]